MKCLWFLVGLLVVGAVSSGQAAETGIWRKPGPPVTTMRVIPRSPEAQLVWAADACWRGCAMGCGRQLKICLSLDASGNCLSYNGSCDRFCQRECRLYGGPLLPWDW